MRRAGLDPGQRYTSVTVLDGVDAPLSFVDSACWIIGASMPLATPTKRSDGTIKTHRWVATEDERQRKAAEIVAWIRGHRVDRLIVERSEQVYAGEGGPAATSARATGVRDADLVAQAVVTMLWGSLEVAYLPATSARSAVCGTVVRGEGQRELDPALRELVPGWASWCDGMRLEDPELADLVLNHERDAAVVALADALRAPADAAAVAIEAGRARARSWSDAAKAKRAVEARNRYRRKHGIPLDTPLKGSLSDGSMPWLDRRR